MTENYFYQVVRHIPQEDGTVLDIPTIDIFSNEKKAKEIDERFDRCTRIFYDIGK